jgi:hypothetical protein
MRLLDMPSSPDEFDAAVSQCGEGITAALEVISPKYPLDILLAALSLHLGAGIHLAMQPHLMPRRTAKGLIQSIERSAFHS